MACNCRVPTWSDIQSSLYQVQIYEIILAFARVLTGNSTAQLRFIKIIAITVNTGKGDKVTFDLSTATIEGNTAKF